MNRYFSWQLTWISSVEERGIVSLNQETAGVGSPITAAMRVTGSPSVIWQSFSNFVNLGATIGGASASGDGSGAAGIGS